METAANDTRCRLSHDIRRRPRISHGVTSTCSTSKKCLKPYTRSHKSVTSHQEDRVSDDEAKQIAVTMVSARVDYCNVVCSLHIAYWWLAQWQTIAVRIAYEITLLTFKCLVLMQPVQASIFIYTFIRQHGIELYVIFETRNRSLCEPFANILRSYIRYFCRAVSATWNSLSTSWADEQSTVSSVVSRSSES